MDLTTQSAEAVEYTDCKTHLQLECLGYDTKQSDDDAPVMLKLWSMQSTPSLRLFPDPLCSKAVAPDRVLSMGQIEQITCANR